MKKKGNPPSAVKDKNGVLLEDKEEIMDGHLEHFADIWQPPEASNKEEEVQEETINEIFENITRIARQSDEAVTTLDEVENAVGELKKKKCKDEWGWKNEIIMAVKEEMKHSLLTLFNRMEVEKWHRINGIKLWSTLYQKRIMPRNGWQERTVYYWSCR